MNVYLSRATMYPTSNQQQATFVDIILPIPLSTPLTYRIPAPLTKLLARGTRVLVPLGKKKIVTGIVAQIHIKSPSYPTKVIVDVLDPVPLIKPVQLTYFHWLAAYYMCTIGEVVRAALPNGLQLSSQSQIRLHPQADLTSLHFSHQELQLIALLQQRTSLTYAEAAAAMKQKSVHDLVNALLSKKVILLFEEVREKYTPKKVKIVSLHASYIRDKLALQDLFRVLERNNKQLEVLHKYLSLVSAHHVAQQKDYNVAKKALIQTGISPSSLQTLLKKGILVEQVVIVSRLHRMSPTNQPLPTLSQAQSLALVAIRHQFRDKDTVLLHGVTASGKTEVYIRLIQETLQGGGQVLYLLPEILLTTQMVKRLQKIFGDRVNVYHSRYADNERVEVWTRVAQGTCAFVLGTRSALFLPFDHLRLIIVDEEHETSYKQCDSVPRYHARDVAIILAQHHHAKVLLGSATPSIESYYNAQCGRYGLVTLQERFGQSVAPKIILTDVRIARQQKALHEDFTKVLLEALQATLDRQEQAIIFQNRRGYASYIICKNCAWVPMCKQCAVSLTYHQYSNALHCHYCGYTSKVPPICDVCAMSQLSNVGSGTEKLEETLQFFFLEKHIQRMDLDTTRGKYSYENIIASLEAGHIDILVGTQMLTKGLDFDRVSLVGVLDIDRLLYFPDFRAGERCFQLLTQVSGRSGRRVQQGSVIIQTNNTHHPVLQDLVKNDYERMYRRELQERKQFRYPPYVRLVRITLRHTDSHLVYAAATRLADRLRIRLTQGVLGPQSPLIAKLKQQYVMDIWVKIKKDAAERLVATKRMIAQESRWVLKKFKKVSIVFDVDPM